MARSARACCAGAAAKAPTQRVARRNRRRMWCLGLRLDAHGGGGGGGGGDGSHHLCSTPSSCDGVECVFAFPTGEARHRARRCTQVRCRRRLQRPDGHGSNRKRRRIARRCGRRHPSRTGGGDDGAIFSTRRAPPSSLHAPRALSSSLPRLVRVRNPQRLLPRTDAGAAAACGAGAAPAADPPGCVGGRVWVQVFV